MVVHADTITPHRRNEDDGAAGLRRDEFSGNEFVYCTGKVGYVEHAIGSSLENRGACEKSDDGSVEPHSGTGNRSAALKPRPHRQ